MALMYKTVASQPVNGPLVQNLTASQITTLTWDFSFNYSAFLSTAAQMVNQDVQAIERGEPEGQRNYLTINGWNGEATRAMDAINQAWSQGKLKGTDGAALAAWPEYPNQIAWATNNNNTVELRWLKWEWELYLVVFALMAIVGYLVYQVLTQHTWSLQTASTTKSGSTGSAPFGTTAPMFGGSPFRLFWLPWYDAALVTAAVVATPYVYRQFVSIEESRAQSAEATTEYRHAKEER